MSRFTPQNLIQALTMLSMAIAVIIAVLVCAGVNSDDVAFAGGVAVGLYVAAFCMWVPDAESVVTGFPL